MISPILQVMNLSVSYDRVHAVRECTLQVEPGSVVAVLGSNGAGKSSLLNALIGIVGSQGSILFEGKSLKKIPTEQRVADGMTLVPERRELFGSLSVEDNLRLGGFRLNRQAASRRIDEIGDLFPVLAKRRTQMAATLSGGERQMLAMGRALMVNPKLLMLDEPSLGLAPLIIKDVFKVILALKARGTSMLLVEQNARAALEVADYAYVFEVGSITHEGTASAMLDDPRLERAYLG
ncbi:ABC transporter ATP-binding protein [Pseudorhodoplanes sinuspersici]|uniref:ABC transporter ATP-binding protein n=1 Tax=Pseudorhodoplanes sinuspersici TaxID=1235591 RepID=A0A1W6ZMK8_9HYPH|nr:ABC transporter ATP-binding protein [Pseudorhodoplanes sinuspersici]ARP98014.1 ABC transporter ATP-binding protein [Pseudorhodoplanes sinuspersici]RKE68232.1 branched-chain amino acid transport system ATP-binding protein [Pseudorhodoplanes sinuspersici]